VGFFVGLGVSGVGELVKVGALLLDGALEGIMGHCAGRFP